MYSLDAMLKIQRDFQARLGYDFSEMSYEARTAYIKEYSLHMEHELHEMLAELPFLKPWKKYTDDPEYQDAMVELAREEWIDVLHFFLNISLALGYTGDSLFLGYMSKHSVNEERQQDTESYKPCVEVLNEVSSNR